MFFLSTLIFVHIYSGSALWLVNFHACYHGAMSVFSQDQVVHNDIFRWWRQLICVPRALFFHFYLLLFFVIQSAVFYFSIFRLIFHSLSSLFAFFSVCFSHYSHSRSTTRIPSSGWFGLNSLLSLQQRLLFVMHLFWFVSSANHHTQQCHLKETYIYTHTHTHALSCAQWWWAIKELCRLPLPFYRLWTSDLFVNKKRWQ